ncbi:MAG: hypothetical protein SFW36_13985 [Leptolyngbyaceae cyanobacterium bins.59]|nr:hypothetical protein [Leptolyngbyaceae cyanobacterium bins.59]
MTTSRIHPLHSLPNLERSFMTLYEQDLKKLVGGQIRHVGLSRDGYPYLIVSHNQENRIFYVFVQADAEGNGAGFLHITEKEGIVA